MIKKILQAIIIVQETIHIFACNFACNASLATIDICSREWIFLKVSGREYSAVSVPKGSERSTRYLEY